MQSLTSCEGRLADWLTGSENNSEWFARDPVAAIRAADLGLDEDVLRDLEEVTASIARKLNAVVHP